MKKSIFSPVVMLLLLASGYLYSCKNGNSQDTRPTGVPTGFQQASTSAEPPPPPGNMVNFTYAAKRVTAGVVHVRTVYADDGSRDMFFRQRMPVAGSGSGVTISTDGYIATNNHVVENASQIQVVYPDRRSFTAKLVGRDPDTDLALLKVDATDLPAITFGNSDNALVGEWVLAVGYPFSLNTTVTAGIISAKGRSIGIIDRSLPSANAQGRQFSTAIESFIQTDAAINPGNSGGALVNINGELIGINTAIASLTGSYAGYAFAVPVNLARKILEDLKAYGKVQRGLLGVSFPMPSVEEQYLRQQGIDPGTVSGVYIIGVQKGSAADAAGLREGDIITEIDGQPLSSSAEFSERIARHRPGDKVQLTYLRKGSKRTVSATLKGEESQPATAQNNQALREAYNKLGVRFAPLSNEMKERYGISSGVVVAEVMEGGFFDRIGIPRGTIITHINGKAVTSTEDVDAALSQTRSGRLQLLGIAPDGSRIAFSLSLGT